MRNISTTNRSEAWGMMIRIKTTLVVQVLKIWVDHAVALFLLCQQHMAVHRQTLSGCQVSRRWCLDLEGKPSPEKMYFWQSILAPLSTRHGEVTTKSQFSQITQLLLLFLLHTLRFYRFFSLCLLCLCLCVKSVSMVCLSWALAPPPSTPSFSVQSVLPNVCLSDNTFLCPVQCPPECQFRGDVCPLRRHWGGAVVLWCSSVVEL